MAADVYLPLQLLLVLLHILVEVREHAASNQEAAVGQPRLPTAEDVRPGGGLALDEVGFSAGENLTVGDGVRITMPSEHTLELYTDIEFTGTDTGAINPEAWPRHVRGVGTHWIDHALISVEDPPLIERFMSECLDFVPPSGPSRASSTRT